MRTGAKWALGGIAAAIILGATRTARGGTVSDTTRASPNVERELPRKYGHDYLSRNRARWVGEFGAIVRDYTRSIWPGLPPEQILGFTAGGTVTANTTDVSSIAFHEIGYFSVPAGPRDGPAPNPDPRASDNQWGALADSARVRNVLGRAATTAPDAWKRAPRDQVAVGVAMLRGLVSPGALDERLRPRDLSAPWAWVVASMAHSAGATGAARHLNRYANELADVSEWARWGRLLAKIADEWRSGVVFGAARSHRNRAWTVTRTWQKMDAARQLAAALSRSPSWWSTQLPNEQATARAVVSAALGVRP